MYADNMTAIQAEIYNAVRAASNSGETICTAISAEQLREWHKARATLVCSVDSVINPLGMAQRASIIIAGDKGIANVIIAVDNGAYMVLTDEGKIFVFRQRAAGLSSSFRNG